MQKDLRLQSLVRQARSKAPFYSSFYRDLPASEAHPVTLTDLPIIDHAEYWAAHARSESLLLTDEQSDGIVMRTGGKLRIPRRDSNPDMPRMFHDHLENRNHQHPQIFHVFANGAAAYCSTSRHRPSPRRSCGGTSSRKSLLRRGPLRLVPGSHPERHVRSACGKNSR
ncbi:uncharacterized protein K489DRAFT_168460 [Dissoconium aciculare CBS 342.82]|jgi:hypothetical protein|uniref:Uncharacterized protein n=1 Tax=Dissoconium aciculare CBS 342.82 TaxID=1314786 RepID=A0A6J3LP30_9PEZI|nr:uncharacterized protein K489DRAFT_168460 [Dissoconium aciculare CBS 342.82]KAF1817721.1 hypothetical protein K489DRAFT_168460 [Dissoconium aciculare CBS 342.82]